MNDIMCSKTMNMRIVEEDEEPCHPSVGDHKSVDRGVVTGHNSLRCYGSIASIVARNRSVEMELMTSSRSRDRRGLLRPSPAKTNCNVSERRV